jgi:cyanophycinase
MLALVGSGEYLPPMEPVDRELLARLGPSPHVVCLPTAAGREGPERIDYWSRLGVDHFTRLGASAEALPVIDRASANDPGLAETIAAADFVYLSGGKPDYLYRTLTGSRTWDAIGIVLANGGLLAGCSAGAMILGEKFFGFPGWNAGFNLMPGITVVPHFDEIPGALTRSIRLLADRELIVAGIEGDTALVRNGSRYEVLGAGGVTLWSDANKTRFTAGPLPSGVLATT